MKTEESQHNRGAIDAETADSLRNAIARSRNQFLQTNPLQGLSGATDIQTSALKLPTAIFAGNADKRCKNISQQSPSRQGSGDTNLQLTLQIDESALVNKVITGINKQQRATGKTLITV